ncbi:hypothetical protein PMI23_03982 [Pseudomonas sp. GM24]|nr:hypothetical protein PMI19_00058 [Pseudomonas sp. GM16]EJM33362.1 hypothetical protein PMI23_03982 [Pseudomonas sp. GM24]
MLAEGFYKVMLHLGLLVGKCNSLKALKYYLFLKMLVVETIKGGLRRSAN